MMATALRTLVEQTLVEEDLDGAAARSLADGLLSLEAAHLELIGNGLVKKLNSMKLGNQRNPLEWSFAAPDDRSIVVSALTRGTDDRASVDVTLNRGFSIEDATWSFTVFFSGNYQELKPLTIADASVDKLVAKIAKGMEIYTSARVR